MPTPAVPTLTLADQLVTVISGAWGPVPPDGVERVYETRIGDDHTGRRVYVFPDLYEIAGQDRSEHLFRHNVGVVIAERYPAETAGAPAVAWVDERVEFVYTRIVRGLDFSKDGALEFTDAVLGIDRYLWTESIEQVQVYNESELVNNRLFLSEVRLVFGEHLE